MVRGSLVDRPFVVGLGGTTRPDSSTGRAPRKGLSAAEAEGAETLPLGAACLDLPICAPGRPDRTSAAQRNSAQPVFGLDGTVDDSAVSDLALVGRQVVDFAVATRSRRLQEEMR